MATVAGELGVMINRLVDLSLRYRYLVLAIYFGVGLWGYVALRQASIDALPDLSDHQVIVFTDWAGHSAPEVEDEGHYPLTVHLAGFTRSSRTGPISISRGRACSSVSALSASCCRRAWCRRSAPMQPESGTSSGTRSRVHRGVCRNFARSRTGSFAINSTQYPASPKSPR